jgi:hypothetical protein
MAIAMTWYRVTCDWCRQKIDIEGASSTLPFGWIEDDRAGIQFMRGSHFCSRKCVENLRAADRVVAALSKEIAERIAKTGGSLFDVEQKDYTLSLYHRGFLVQADR